LDNLFIKLISFLPSLFTIIGASIILWLFHWFFIGKHHDLGNERKFPRQIILLALVIVGLLATVFTLPISEGSRNQLIALIGLLISGIIAFSSTNIVSNLMAGILLRITKPFVTGDFIRVAEYFGRVSERGLFDTEIQTEMRELVSLPNTYLTKNPVTTIRSSGTIISASLSLGYDVHHCKAESLLIKAAEKCGIEEPFVHILELGNYSITYRISGLLIEVKRLISVRSNLYQSILDTLHEAGVEIMSPTVMNQRQMNIEQKIIPSIYKEVLTKEAVNAEEIAFDKAELAEKIEKEKEELIKKIQEMEAEMKNASDDDRARIKEKMDECREKLKTLDVSKIEADLEKNSSKQRNNH
jgi:small-conductance mechanosensitive channel